MKRFFINQLISEAHEMIERHGFVLPPFVHWSPAEFASKQEIAQHLMTARCGWDVTDHGRVVSIKGGWFFSHSATAS